MNIAEILRGLADKIASMETGQEAPTQSMGQAQLQPVQVDNTDHTDDAVMIAPLQQKIELLKKSVGVPSAFDGQEQGAPDELDIIKKNAGVSPIAIQVAEEDEPFEG
jgi:hypothetical protein